MEWTNRIIGSDKMVYLDYAAATPTDEEVLNEFVKAKTLQNSFLNNSKQEQRSR